MNEYSRFIDPCRRSVPVSKQLVDADGSCVFGTFDSEFESMDLLRAKKPTYAPQFLNRFKLTLWEAAEINLKEGVLLAVVCDMGFFGKTLNIFFDRRTKKVTTWDTNLSSRNTHIAPNLLRGSVTEAETKTSRVHYENHFEQGKCHLSGHHTGSDKSSSDTLSYDFHLSRISKPSVVSIPFGPNRPLYSQKDFFHVEGSLTLNCETLSSDENTTAVVDDHRGYYPRRMHYDWVTTMGTNASNGKKQFLALNLTSNQSMDQDKYNENLIWKEGTTSLLPPVTFRRHPQSKDFKGESTWLINDEHDMVRIRFTVQGISPMILHAGVISIDYYVAFGELGGYVRDEDGTMYILDGMMGMGEDKTMLF